MYKTTDAEPEEI